MRETAINIIGTDAETSTNTGTPCGDASVWTPIFIKPIEKIVEEKPKYKITDQERRQWRREERRRLKRK